jgi:hypothetical protein
MNPDICNTIRFQCHLTRSETIEKAELHARFFCKFHIPSSPPSSLFQKFPDDKYDYDYTDNHTRSGDIDT